VRNSAGEERFVTKRVECGLQFVPVTHCYPDDDDTIISSLWYDNYAAGMGLNGTGSIHKQYIANERGLVASSSLPLCRLNTHTHMVSPTTKQAVVLSSCMFGIVSPVCVRDTHFSQE
jgi:hypothetical protein